MNHQRRNFLKFSGLMGLAAMVPGKKILAQSASEASCTLIPTETAGPFPLDLTENTTYFRQDITEGKPGVPLNLTLRIIGAGNCAPMQNVRVNIWRFAAKSCWRLRRVNLSS